MRSLAESMSPQFRDDLIRKWFNDADKNGDGVLSWDELSIQMADKKFKSALVTAGINLNSLKDLMDLDGDGEIDFDEFKAVLNCESVDVGTLSSQAFGRLLDIWQNPQYAGGEDNALTFDTKEEETAAEKIGLFCIQVEMKRFLCNMYLEVNEETKEGLRKQEFDDCTKLVLKSRNITEQLNGNSRVWWGQKGKDIPDYVMKTISQLEETLDYKVNKHQKKVTKHSLIGFYIRFNYEIRTDDNVGAFYLNKITPPRLMFRSGTMVNLQNSDSVYRNLIDQANVKHVVNLYCGPFPLGDIYEQEKKIVEKNGGTYHDERKVKPSRKWRYLIQKEKNYENQKEEAFRIVAGVIKDILLPKGRRPKDGENVLLHCGGGMHRTGMIVGIIRKVFSDAKMEDILKDYRKHVAYRDENFTGGFEPLNQKFIQEFPANTIRNLEEIEKVVVPDGLFNEYGYLTQENHQRVTLTK